MGTVVCKYNVLIVCYPDVLELDNCSACLMGRLVVELRRLRVVGIQP